MVSTPVIYDLYTVTKLIWYAATAGLSSGISQQGGLLTAHNDYSLSTSGKSETGISGLHSEIPGAYTFYVHSLLLENSDAFYKAYPAIEKKLKEYMSKEKEIILGDFADKEKMKTLIVLKFDAEGMIEKGLIILTETFPILLLLCILRKIKNTSV